MTDENNVEDMKKYIGTLQSDVTKLQLKLFKSEESIKKLQELNALYCKVSVKYQNREKIIHPVHLHFLQNLSKHGKKWLMIFLLMRFAII